MELLKKVLQHLQTIQGSRKGSIGSMHNVYLPQLKRKFVDDLATEVSDYLANKSPGIELIASERERQIKEEGWTAAHDMGHSDNELAWAAVCYAAPDKIRALKQYEIMLNSARGADPVCYQYDYKTVKDWIDPWPWDEEWDKRHKHNRLRRLVIAGALIAAEIDRISALERDVKLDSALTDNHSDSD